MVRRIYVEKRDGFDTGAQILKKELKENLGIAGLQRVRLVQRYDVENVDDALFERAKALVFSEPNLDTVTDERFEAPEGAFVFGIEYLPGQFDQRADSAETCIRLLAPAWDVTPAEAGAAEAEPIVRCAKIIVVEGALSNEIRDRIKRYCINPVDSRETGFEKPETLSLLLTDPAPVRIVEGFRQMDEGQLSELAASMGFAMCREDLAFVREHFQSVEFRDPTVTELRVIDTYWSDHCRHTTFLTELTEVDFEGEGLVAAVQSAWDDYWKAREEVYGAVAAATRPVTLMDLATIGAKTLKKRGVIPDLDESEEINASSIRVKAEIVPVKGAKDTKPVKEDWLVMFKNETHNHPTEIEPFGGAATCLGGAIRDPLSGRAYVYQAMRVTGSGDPGTAAEHTLPGKLTQYQITRGAAKGYSSYGNQIGVATGFVDEIYDETYVAKRLEIGAVIGAAPANSVRRDRPVRGDAVLLVGGRTGRDGIGGATGSSKEHTEESLQTAGAEVQKGNPPVERDIQRLFRRPEAARLIKRCNDFGAGGVSVAIGELAPSLDVDLDAVLKKYEGLDGTELAISESQERMAVVVSKEDAAIFAKFAAEENVEVTEVAKVTDTGRFRMYWRGDVIFDLPRSFLDSNGAVQRRTALICEKDIRVGRATRRGPGGIGSKNADAAEEQDYEPDARELFTLLSDLNCAGKRGLIEQFDSTIGAGSVLLPFGGRHQLTPAMGMAAKLPVKSGDTHTATLMTYGFDPRVSKESPFHGAMYAVLESLTRIAAMGGDALSARLSFQEYFPKLGQVPTRWGAPVMALLGALKAQLALGIPAIGGKDSMSGTFRDIDVAPTLVSFAVCICDARHILSPEFKKAGNRLVLLRCGRDEHHMPDFTAFRRNAARVYELAQAGRILSASSIGAGGLFTAASRMAFGNGIGAALYAPSKRDLLYENYGSLLFETDAAEDVEKLFHGLDAAVVGETIETAEIEIRNPGDALDERLGCEAPPSPGSAAKTPLSLPLSEILNRWETPLVSVFPVEAAPGAVPETEIPVLEYAERMPVRAKTQAIHITKPRVFIPIFPGTNCEEDSRRAFERAGAEVHLTGLRTHGPDALEKSIARMAEEIKKCQIIMIPGGFSGGDEPEGSAKFIAAVFRNPRMQDAVADLLERREGLMLGVCNGFQALVKLGLLPGGQIADPDEHAPALTYNTIGRHQSKLVRVRIASV
ncbi:MAG: phosphoribosylformylglycinamidine synthase, partial [Clostridiales bacterium]|nr:phosphoribosylformylglycinamidine synthase [Clostridiales bacterium]